MGCVVSKFVEIVFFIFGFLLQLIFPKDRCEDAIERKSRQKCDTISNDIIVYLNLHRDLVFGLSHAIKAEHANVELLLEYMTEATRLSNVDKTEIQKEIVNIAEHLSDGVENSILCKCDALSVSFKTLNKYIHENVLDILQEGNANIDPDVPGEDDYEPDIPDIDKTKVTDLIGRINDIWVELLLCKKKCEKQKKSLSARDTETVELQNQNQSLAAELRKLQIRISCLEKENIRLKNKTTSVQEQYKLQDMERQTEHEEELKALKILMEAEKRKYQNDILHEQEQSRLKDTERKKQHEEQLQILKKSFENEKAKLKHNITTLQEQVQFEDIKRKAEYEQLRIDLTMSFKTEKTKLEQDTSKLLRLHEEQKRKCAVQLFYQGKGELMPKVLDDMKALLVDTMGKKRHELQFVTCLTRPDVDPEIPLLVLCINVSRIGTDASTTLQYIQDKASKNVLLVMLHHKDKHALPNQASDRVLSGPEFHSLAGISDLGFQADKGIYTCDMNSQAIKGIANFITSF